MADGANMPPAVLAGPINIEAEQALLGALLFDNGSIERMGDLDSRHFAERVNGRIFDVAAHMIAAGGVADPTTVGARIADDPAFQDLGGLRYLADLVDYAPPATGVRDYANIIIDSAKRRDMVGLAGDIAARSSDLDLPARKHLEEIEGAVFALSENSAEAGGFQPFAKGARGAIEAAIAAHSRDGGLTGLSTGLIDLDRKLGGLHPSDLIIIAARPSMGKTALATNIGHVVAKLHRCETDADGVSKTVAGAVVGFFSLEMSEEQLCGRIIAKEAGVSGDRIRRGETSREEIARLHQAEARLHQMPLHIDATGGLPIGKLCARARRLHRHHGLGLLIIDYLQLVTTGGKGRSRVEEVTEITQALKALAKELNIPVIALSQLSRQVESRDDKHPQLSDLRESGSIEQDADVVAFIYREEYYKGRAEPRAGTPQHKDWEAEMDEVHGIAEVIVAKQRHGPIGTVRLHWDADLTAFGNLASEDRYPSHRNPYGDD